MRASKEVRVIETATVVDNPVHSRVQLLRILGLGFGLAVAVGNTISAGILRTPGEVAQHLPNMWIFLGVWVLAGLYALLCAFSMAELATMLPSSGGHYVYARYAFGEYPGFFIGWCDWLGNSGTNALVSMVIGEYAGLLFPALAGKSTLIACTVVTVFSLLQWVGTKWGASVQNVSSAIKALMFVALALACLFYATPSHAGSPVPPLPQGFGLIAAMILAMQAAVYTYDGWQAVIYFSEEVHDPARDIPRSMFGGVLLVMGIYVLLNVALVRTLPIGQIAGNKLALGSAAGMLWGPRADTILQVVTIISMLAAVNAIQLMAPRIMFAMSRDGLFHHSGAHVNRGGTPDVALLMSLVVEVAFILTGTFNQVIASLALFFVVNYIMDFLSVLVLRRREPERARPYRAWGYPYTTVFALIVSFAYVVGVFVSDTSNSIRGLVILAASYPLFRLVKWTSRASSH